MNIFITNIRSDDKGNIMHRDRHKPLSLAAKSIPTCIYIIIYLPPFRTSVSVLSFK